MTYSNGPDLAEAMGVEFKHLVWLATRCNEMYTPLARAKRSGAIRYVYSPDIHLRRVQTWLLSNVIDTIDASEIAFAFEKHTSTVQALEPHRGNLTLIRIDLADFYGHIKYADVQGAFSRCGLSYGALSIATRLCLLDIGYGASLPQGGICSPMISNRVLQLFDCALVGLAEKWRATVTRYADDILISMPSTIGKEATARLVEDVTNIAFRYGQEVNTHKTHAMTGVARKSALGLTVGDTITMFRKARHNIRAMCYNVEKEGEMGIYPATAAKINKCKGMYAYMKVVDQEHAAKLAERFRWLND